MPFQGIDILEYRASRELAMVVVDSKIDHDAPEQGVRIPHLRGTLIREQAQVCFLHQLFGIFERAASSDAELYEALVARQIAPDGLAVR